MSRSLPDILYEKHPIHKNCVRAVICRNGEMTVSTEWIVVDPTDTVNLTVNNTQLPSIAGQDLLDKAVMMVEMQAVLVIHAAKYRSKNGR